MVNIAWERELCSFADVAAVARCRFPTTSQRCISSNELTACFERSNQNPRCTPTSSSSTKTLLEGHLKPKMSAVITPTPKIERMEGREKSYVLENVKKDLSTRSGVQQSNKLKVPFAMNERHSTGSPKLSTPIRSGPRSSEVSMSTIVRTPEVFSAVRFETPKRNLASEQLSLIHI